MKKFTFIFLNLFSMLALAATPPAPPPIFIDSLTQSGRNASLVNDASTPGNNKCYSTNGSGVRGWFSCNTATGSVTSVGTGTGLTGGPITTTGTISLLPPTLSVIGGVKAVAPVSHNWINSIDTSGVPALSQPAFTDVSGQATTSQLPSISNNFLLGNTSGSTGPPSGVSLSSLIDSAFGNAQGDILYRGASAWTVLTPGTSGNFLKTQGAAANPVWAAGNAGTVTSVGLFDGSTLPIYSISNSPVTTSGTLQFTLNAQSANQVFAGPTTGVASQPGFRALVGADLPNPSAATLGGVESIAPVSHNFLTSISTSGVPAQAQPAFTDISGQATTSQLPSISSNFLLANTTGGSAAPVGVSLSSLIDSALGSAQGDILYRDSGAWQVLAPGTSGNFLKTQGAAANPTWAAGNAGTVTSVALSDGSSTPIYTISGSPVTSSGTLTETLSTQVANTVFAGPSSGSNAQPTFRALGAGDIPNPANVAIFYEDFITGFVASGGGSFTASNQFTTQSTFSPSYSMQGTHPGSVSGHPGVLKSPQQTGRTATAAQLLVVRPAARSRALFIAGAGVITGDFNINIFQLGNGTDDAQVAIGLMANPIYNGASAAGVYWSYQNAGSANWQFKVSDGTTTTVVTTAIPVTTGWHHLAWVVNAAGTSVTYSVDGVSGGSPVTTHIPTVKLPPCFMLWKRLAPAAFFSSVDYFYITETFPTPRLVIFFSLHRL